ncbi:prolyl oligopeptidase family protein [Tessaracoccus sp. MC1756]|uniref:prolyl oligopeptidase family serine peptidase n=1 Tax=Tessaracoccus sp. MC1756 TaxID=2760311 RepID=UPI0015FF001E|nr:prolyl oligopeptidase family serine peptidase [Tessaracoccus sp. MC1756]MBB1509831.1 S9 family peptidase [Tessaracoccus sp. MC1756]
MTYPHTRRDDTVDNLHGTAVPDPYRWLEDADNPEVQEWVAAQRDFTEAQLQHLPARGWFTELMGRIVARPRAGVPLKRGGRWLVSRNDGTSAQDLWYTAPTLEELVDGGEVVLDPNTWSDDGTSSLSTFTVARDGSLMAYARSDGGSDWQHIRTRDLRTGEDLDGEVTAKFSSPAWLPDNSSFLYTTFDEADDARGTATAGLGVARLMIHRPGGDDELLLTFPDEPHTMASGEVSHDDNWLVVSIFRGTENVNRLWVYPITTADGRSTLGEPVKLLDTADAEYTFIRTDGGHLYLHTDLDAPLGRVIRLNVAGGELTEVVPESDATLAAVEAAGEGLLLAYLDDAQHRVEYRNLDGSDPRPVDLPAGALVALDSSPLRDEAFVGLSTIATPTASFHVPLPVAEAAPATEEPDRLKGPHTLPARPIALSATSERFAPSFTMERHRAPSADGTPVPYFLITPDDDRSGPRPTLLYGYGGFKIPVLADYRPGWSAWLAAGGALAIANLRGGGEFGTRWYDDGRLANKQRVFDDFIGVAEHLISTGVTSSKQLAIYGRSNGGLLVGAALTQRPDLFAAAMPTVGVLDVLRFHKFTIGSAWISDFGDPDTPEGFDAAFAYSPLHRIEEGTQYPPTMILTADHDDRVVPLHSFKFAAALQAVSPAEAWLRVESSAGHGAGKSLQMVASEWADLLAFAAHHTGLVP